MGEDAIGGDEEIYTAAFATAQSGGELKRVEGAKAMFAGVARQQRLSTDVVFLDQTVNYNAPRFQNICHIDKEFTRFLHVHCAGPNLDGGYGSQFNPRQRGRENPVRSLGEYTGYNCRSFFLVEQLGEGARIEEIQHQLVIPALRDDQISERSGDFLPPLLDLLDTSRLTFLHSTGDLGLGELSGGQTVVKRLERNGDTFFLIKRNGLDRPQDAVLEYGFHSNRHAFSLRHSEQYSSEQGTMK